MENLIYIILLAVGGKLQKYIRPTKGWLLGTGSVSGVMGGLFGMHGRKLGLQTYHWQVVHLYRLCLYRHQRSNNSVYDIGWSAFSAYDSVVYTEKITTFGRFSARLIINTLII